MLKWCIDYKFLSHAKFQLSKQQFFFNPILLHYSKDLHWHTWVREKKKDAGLRANSKIALTWELKHYTLWHWHEQDTTEIVQWTNQKPTPPNKPNIRMLGTLTHENDKTSQQTQRKWKWKNSLGWIAHTSWSIQLPQQSELYLKKPPHF